MTVAETVEVVASKVCKMCGVEKPLTEFTPDRHNKKDGRHLYCRPCRAQYHSRANERDRAEGRVLRRAREAAVMQLVERHQDEFDALMGAALRVEMQST